LQLAAERLYECSFLIPVRRDRILSDGRPHRVQTWAWLEHALFVFGGLTRAPDHEGGYLDPDTGELVWDRSRQYTVALARVRVEELRALLREACRKFGQKCIYLSVAGRVEFVWGENHVPG
jgi:hypothetical protein